MIRRRRRLVLYGPSFSCLAIAPGLCRVLTSPFQPLLHPFNLTLTAIASPPAPNHTLATVVHCRNRIFEPRRRRRNSCQTEPLLPQTLPLLGRHRPARRLLPGPMAVHLVPTKPHPPHVPPFTPPTSKPTIRHTLNLTARHYRRRRRQLYRRAASRPMATRGIIGPDKRFRLRLMDLLSPRVLRL